MTNSSAEALLKELTRMLESVDKLERKRGRPVSFSNSEFREFMFQQLTEKEEASPRQFSVRVVDVDLAKKILAVDINGRRYTYTTSGDISFPTLVQKFKTLLGVNRGRALAWLKKNSVLLSGSVKG